MSLGGDGHRCPYDSDGLVLDGAVKGLAVGGAIVFLVDGRMYVGYGLGSTKSLQIIPSNSRRVMGSTLSSHSKYWHISLHLVDLAQLEHSLRDDGPQMVTRGFPSGRKTYL